MRTQFERIIRRAELEPWKKLFQNLRSTRESELAESYPLHVVTALLGNSEPVARKHYLQSTSLGQRKIRRRQERQSSEPQPNALCVFQSFLKILSTLFKCTIKQ